MPIPATIDRSAVVRANMAGWTDASTAIKTAAMKDFTDRRTERIAPYV